MKILVPAALLLVLPLKFYSQESVYHFDPGRVRQYSSFDEPTQSRGSSPETNLFSNGRWSTDYTVAGIIGTVYTTTTDGTNLYVGGNFKIAGNVTANNIACWDGQKWSAIGSGPENGVHGDIPTVHALAWADGKLFAGGQFATAGSLEVNGIAYWDGEKWNRLGNDSTNGVRQIIKVEDDTLVGRGYVWSLFSHKNKIYAGGWFQLAGTDTSNGIASWDLNTESWESLKGGFRSKLEYSQVTSLAFAADSNLIYMGGQFDFAGDLPAKNIIAWDGTDWVSAGNLEFLISDLEVDSKHNLYAGGNGNPDIDSGASGLWKWNGVVWESIPGPENYRSTVSCMEIIHDTLYAGGSFLTDDFNEDYAFATYDGTAWHKIDGLRKTQNRFFEGNIARIEMVNNRMYLAGDFTEAGTLHPVNVVEWDYVNSKWKILNDGLPNQGIYDGYIQDLAQRNDTLYAGGSFTVAGGIEARNIAQWTEEGWKSLGNADSNGIHGSVYTLLIDGTDVFVGGHFDRAGPEATYHIARWNGKKWFPIGIGVGGVSGAHVNAIARVDNYLYVAGYFAVVGDVENYELPANSIARFNLDTERWETLGRGIEYVYGIPGIVYDLELHGKRIYVAGDFQTADDHYYKNFAVLDGNKWSGMDDTDSIGIEGVVEVVKVIGDEIYIGGYLYPMSSGKSSGILKWNGSGWEDPGERLSEHAYVSDIAAFDSGLFAGGLFSREGTEINNLAWFDGDTWNPVGGGVTTVVTNLAVQHDRLFATSPIQLITEQGLSVGIAQFDFHFPDTVINDTTIQDTVINSIKYLYDPFDNIKAGNYPNPFDSYTRIYFSLGNAGPVKITVYDQHGRKVRDLLDEFRHQGPNTAEFRKGDLGPGLYIYNIICNEYRVTRRMIIR